MPRFLSVPPDARFLYQPEARLLQGQPKGRRIFLSFGISFHLYFPSVVITIFISSCLSLSLSDHAQAWVMVVVCGRSVVVYSDGAVDGGSGKLC